MQDYVFGGVNVLNKNAKMDVVTPDNVQHPAVPAAEAECDFLIVLCFDAEGEKKICHHRLSSLTVNIVSFI